jgi:hypothetical protein
VSDLDRLLVIIESLATQISREKGSLAAEAAADGSTTRILLAEIKTFAKCDGVMRRLRRRPDDLSSGP